MVPKLEERYPNIVGPRPHCSPHRAEWPKDRFEPTQMGLSVGKVRMNLFTFWDAGNILPLHSHGDADSHLTFVNAGSFRIFGDGWERVVKTGDRLQFDPGVIHGYEALEAGSQLTNIIY